MKGVVRNKVKLKKKIKKVLLFLFLVVIAIAGYFIYQKFNSTSEVKETKVVNEIKEYGYKLKENKPEKYKKMFEELKTILSEEEVDEEKYAQKISEMFIYDFYSLKDKTAKTDIGGVDFVYNEILENFLQNAQDTYYKYIENNIYNNRKQSLPVVNNIEIENVETKNYSYGDKEDEKAYYVKATWDYTDEAFSDYQKEAELVFIHDGIKLSLVELQK